MFLSDFSLHHFQLPETLIMSSSFNSRSSVNLFFLLSYLPLHLQVTNIVLFSTRSLAVNNDFLFYMYVCHLPPFVTCKHFCIYLNSSYRFCVFFFPLGHWTIHVLPSIIQQNDFTPYFSVDKAKFKRKLEITNTCLIRNDSGIKKVNCSYIYFLLPFHVLNTRPITVCIIFLPSCHH